LIFEFYKKKKKKKILLTGLQAGDQLQKTTPLSYKPEDKRWYTFVSGVRYRPKTPRTKTQRGVWDHLALAPGTDHWEDKVNLCIKRERS
jgi:hypothetical protein